MKNPNTSAFKICPRCGSTTFIPVSEKSFECSECRFTLFMNPAASTAALILDDSRRLLIVLRKSEPAKGTWDLPGGFVDPGENAEEALSREIQEELNLNVEEFKYFGSFPNTYKYDGIVYLTVDITFLVRVENFEGISAGDDVESYLFCPLNEIDPEKFGLDSIRTIVLKFLEKKNTLP